MLHDALPIYCSICGVTARIKYELDGVMKLQLDLESVPVTHWRIVCHALSLISESVVSWVTYIGELHAFLLSYIIPSLYVTHSSSIIVLSFFFLSFFLV